MSPIHLFTPSAVDAKYLRSLVLCATLCRRLAPRHHARTRLISLPTRANEPCGYAHRRLRHTYTSTTSTICTSVLARRNHSSSTSSTAPAPATSQYERLQTLLESSDYGAQDSTGREALRGLVLAVRRARTKDEALPGSLTSALCAMYGRLSLENRHATLVVLARTLGRDPAAAQAAVQHASKGELDAAKLQRLHRALQPQYETLFYYLNSLPQGIAFLLHARADMLSAPQLKTDAALRVMSADLQEHLKHWFNTAFLQLRQLTAADSRAVLDKLVQYEAVHPMRSQHDLEQRLGYGRRCLALFHPSVPDEPLVFIQVALLRGIATAIGDILAKPVPSDAEEAPSTAIFYSITSSQPGLRGVDLGGALIKRAVQVLQASLPTLSVFCTLSPVPGFRSWLSTQLSQRTNPRLTHTRDQQHPGEQAWFGQSDTLLLPHEAESLLATEWPLSERADSIDRTDSVDSGLGGAEGALARALGAWSGSILTVGQVSVLRPVLTRLCARYLVLERKRGKAMNGVANFHIRNGSLLHNINWAANTSERGMDESYGIMVNYLYDLDRIEGNRDAYTNHGLMTCSDKVIELLEQSEALTRQPGSDSNTSFRH